MENYILRREYLINNETVKLNYIAILNLLFSFNFENMKNEGEHTIESVWTIDILIPQTSCLDKQLVLPNSTLEKNNATIIINGKEPLLKEVKLDQAKDKEYNSESIIKCAIIAGIRSSLCYPLTRN